jgi:MscS family membrane protein
MWACGPTRRGALALGVTLAAVIFLLSPAGLAAQQGLTIAERASINPGLDVPPPQVAWRTPAASWRSFLSLGRAGLYGAAAHLLDLTEVPQDEQRAVGAEVAEKLFKVVEKLGLHDDAVTNDDPQGPKENGEALNAVVAARFQRAAISGEIWLRRTKDAKTGELAWLFTRQTVSGARFWYSVIVEGEKPHGTANLNEGLPPAPAGVRRANPRETVVAFLSAAGEGRFLTAAQYLNLAGIPPAKQATEGARLARRLMLVLLRTGGVNPAKISNDPMGAPEIGVAENQERVATVEADGEPVDILLSRQWSPDLGVVWTFAPATVAQIDALYGAHGLGWLGDHMPLFFFSVGVAGVQLWQWLALLVIAVGGWGLARLLGHWLVVALRAITRRTRGTWDDAIPRALDGPLGFLLWAAALALASPLVGLTPGVQSTTHVIWKLLAVVGVAWLMARIIDLFAAQVRASGAHNALALSFIPVAQRVAKVLVFALLVLAGLDVVGVKVVAVLAGLGLGGLAVAFAAQKTLENLFGAFAIAGDRPFKVGDFVLIGDVLGTVEDVGLRSTRVRTLERTLVTIPNGSVTSGLITNFSLRDRMLYNPTIGVVYGTTAAQLTLITDEIRKLLLTHPAVWPEVTRCRFAAFGASSLDIEVFCWIDTSDYNRFTAISEELNFRISEIVESAGSSFAFPSRSVYIAREGGINGERAAQASNEVAQRRQRGELAVPEPSEDLLDKLLTARKGRAPGAGS